MAVFKRLVDDVGINRKKAAELVKNNIQQHHNVETITLTLDEIFEFRINLKTIKAELIKSIKQ